MIVCQCKVVNDRAITDAVAAGAKTLAQLARATGAGTDCGCCVFAVKALLVCNDEASTHRPGYPAAVPLASTMETHRAAS